MTDALPPMAYDWTGEAWTIQPRFAKLADKHFVIGETRMMVPHEDRSMASHGHYFASVNEAWQNLNEADTERFPTPNHLRAYALIHAGYRDESSIVCASHAEALRVAAWARPANDLDIVVVVGNVVRRWRAQSQSFRAMGKERFQASKTAVLDFLADMIGVAPSALTGRAA